MADKEKREIKKVDRDINKAVKRNGPGVNALWEAIERGGKGRGGKR